MACGFGFRAPAPKETRSSIRSVLKLCGLGKTHPLTNQDSTSSNFSIMNLTDYTYIHYANAKSSRFLHWLHKVQFKASQDPQDLDLQMMDPPLFQFQVLELPLCFPSVTNPFSSSTGFDSRSEVFGFWSLLA